MLSKWIAADDAERWLTRYADESAHLAVLDPPYYKIVKSKWDRKWRTEAQYVDWLVHICNIVRTKLTPDGSLILFGGIGKHGQHPLFAVLNELETAFTFRNWITWVKRRGYGKQHDYLYLREEILWLSVSPERTRVRFNIPLSDVKRGYPGFNKKYPARSEFKRIGNVWTDIHELMRPEREAQKPIPLLERIIRTHSNERDTVIDCFAGWGTTGVAALRCGRQFAGCEENEADAAAANERVDDEFWRQQR